MSCKEYEMNLFVYDELSPAERLLLDKHLKMCDSCSNLFQEIRQTQLLLGKVAEENPVPPNAARLTGNIMSKIKQPNKLTWLEQMDQFLTSQATRYGLSALSSVLVMIFCIQSFDDSRPVQKIETTFAHAVILNAKIFRENFSHNKEKRALFADCRSPFQSSESTISCMKNKLK